MRPPTAPQPAPDRPWWAQPASAGVPASASARQRSSRRFRALNLTTTMPLFAVVGVLLVTVQSRTWGDAVVLSLGVVALLVAFERWTAGAITRVAVPCLAVAAAVWCYGALVIGGDGLRAFFAVAVIGSLTVPQLPRHRAAAAVGLPVFVAAVGVVALLGMPEVGRSEVVLAVVVPTGFTVVLTGLMFPNHGFYDLMAELEEAREREAELAVLGERMRFASDLHDIQGHTLHVVKLKIALARRLLHSDAGRAEQELSEVYALVGDTIAQTKELAYGRRRLNLTAELENARNLLEAAGIRVRIDHRADPGVGRVDLLAQVLRETTTNVLRHSRARLVRIALDERSITVVNDGVAATVLPELNGLAVLGRRVADAGGELSVDLADGHVRTSAAFPAAGTVATTEGDAR